MKQLNFIFLLVLSLFLFFGCTQVPTCGDGICNENENSQTCSVDCGGTLVEEGYLQVYVTDANTGWFIEGAQVNFTESKLDACSLNLSAKPIVVTTNSNGVAEIKLEANKNYVAIVVGDYYPFDYKCSVVSSKEKVMINYSLVKLPAKPECQKLAGTRELAVSESIDVNGINGDTLQLKLDDYLVDATIKKYDWVNMYQAKWVLTYPSGIPKVWGGVPHVKLNEMFKNSFYNNVDFITTCWKEGNELPFAVISTN